MKKRFSESSIKGKYFVIFLVLLSVWFLYLTLSTTASFIEENAMPQGEVQLEIVAVNTDVDSANYQRDGHDVKEKGEKANRAEEEEEARAFLRRKQERGKETGAGRDARQKARKWVAEKDLPALLADTQMRFKELAQFSQEQTVKRDHNSYDLNVCIWVG
jgi:hypothetical protein